MPFRPTRAVRISRIRRNVFVYYKMASVKASESATVPIEGALDRGFTRVGRSRIAGKGVFAKRRIPRGSRIIEYLGERISLASLLSELAVPTATNVYLFRLRHDTVIDGARNGNDARFINHSCDPNCEVFIFNDRVYIYAMRDILRGEELTFDYQLGPAIRSPKRAVDLELYACHCGSPNCRGTMIARPPRVKKNAAKKRRTARSV